MRVLVTNPAQPIVGLADALEHLRVENGVEDTLIEGMVAAATGLVEDWTQRAFGVRTLEALYDVFETCRCVRLPEVPAIDVVSVSWRGADGQWHDGNLSDVDIDGRDLVTNGEPPWTGMDIRPGSLRVVYRAGYADDASTTPPRSTVPYQIRAAILLMTSFLYHNRGAQTAEPPAAVAVLLQPFRVFA